MAKVRFYPLDLTYSIKKNRPVVQIFGRTADGQQICVIDDSFEPYFYVIPRKGESILDKIKKIRVEKKDRVYIVTDVQAVKKRLLDEDVDALKVFVNMPKGVPLIRDVIKDWEAVSSCNEYDIKYVRRYLIDKGLNPFTLVEAEGEKASERYRVPVIKADSVSQYSDETLKEPKILSIDIETYNPEGRSVNPEKHPIIMVGLYGSNYKKVVTWKRFKTDHEYIEFVKSESDLIAKLKEIIEKQKPDVICGYYSDGFDLPYIKTRADKYKIPMDIGLDYSELNISGREKVKAKINGIVHIDVLKFILKNFSKHIDVESYSLDNVAFELLGEKKIEVDLDKMADVWDNKTDEIERFCEYNLHDAKLTYDLCKYVLPNIVELVKIVGIPPYDLIRMGFSQLVEWFIIRQAANFNEIALERPHYDEVGERRRKSYKGAFVFEPKPGLYKGIVILDFRSLYPTIIASHNISPGTLRCKCCAGKEIAPVEGEKIWFCSKKKGFIPKIIEDIITRRMRIKEMKGADKDKLLYARQWSLKDLANSMYGYLGFFNARWYSLESVRAITAWAREYIQNVIKQVEKEGFKVIYGDTDSVFMILQEKTKEDAQKFVEKVNRTLPGIMELEYEGYYPAGIFVSAKASKTGAKKKYALLDEDDNIKITGFETVRRDWSFIAKDVQKDVLSIVLRENNSEKALRHVRQVISDLKEHKIPVKKLLIYTQLKKEIEDYSSIGPHVAAAQRMKNRGIPVGPGTMIKYVVTKGKGRIKDKVKLEDEVKPEDYDADYYIDSQIIPAVERILDVLGYSEGEIKGEGEQSKLGKYFG